MAAPGTIETFKMHGGALNTGTTDQHTSVINRLAELGLTGTYSSGAVSITIAGLAITHTDGAGISRKLWQEMLAICESVNAEFTYTVAIA